MMLFRDPRNRRELPDEEWYERLESDVDRYQLPDVGSDDCDGNDSDIDVDVWLESDDWDELAEMTEWAPTRRYTPGEDAADRAERRQRGQQRRPQRSRRRRGYAPGETP